MYCPNCGTKNIEDSNYCFKCGLHLDQIKKITELKENKNINNQDKSTKFSYVKNPTKITKFLKIILWISLILVIITLISDFYKLKMLYEGFSIEEGESHDKLQIIIGFFNITLFILTSITFLRWKYIMNKNCHGFNAEGMKFSPGWSIGYYFIPILFFFRPYQAMKEIWRVSKNPLKWKEEKGSTLLVVWWTLFLISNILNNHIFFQSLILYSRLNADLSVSTNELIELTYKEIFSGIIEIQLIIVFILMISEIYNMQEKLIKETNS